jgi:hypothetical protein
MMDDPVTKAKTAWTFPAIHAQLLDRLADRADELTTTLPKQAVRPRPTPPNSNWSNDLHLG